jgi:hypothetical protein
MLEFTMSYTRPDGTVPLIGDADNGRLFRLKAWDLPEREWNDHRYLLAIGAVLYKRQDFAVAAGDQWEEAAWLLGHEAIERHQIHAPAHDCDEARIATSHYVYSGIHVLRNADAHLVFEEGKIGSSGRGVHNHENPLGYDLWMAGVPIIVDPGCYTYTADYPVRHKFRAVEAHNTVSLATPALPKDKQALFEFHPDYETTTDVLISDGGYEIISGVRRSVSDPGAFNHRRTIIFDQKACIFLFSDFVESQFETEIVIRMHLGERINAIWSEDSREIILMHNGIAIAKVMLISPELRAAIVADFVSPCYGVLRSSWTICLSAVARNLHREEWQYLLCPSSVRPDLVQLWKNVDMLSIR